jgi:hypothetical protein
MDVLFAVAMYATPLAGLAFVKKPRVALACALVGSLVAEIAYLRSSGIQPTLGVVVANYLQALIPLGVWAGFLGGIVTPLLLPLARRLSSPSLVAVASFGGAATGMLFMLGYSALAVATQTTSEVRDLRSLALAGTVAGGACGIICGATASSDARAVTPVSR